jgi:hypothetical protein
MAKKMSEGADESKQGKLKVWFINGAILAVFVIFLLSIRWGPRSPCAWFERNEYERRFYVRLYPYGGETKSYRVPALIKAYKEGGGEESRRFYTIAYAVMPNGGTVTFDYQDESLQIDQRVKLTDTGNREWAVELTCEPAD